MLHKEEILKELARHKKEIRSFGVKRLVLVGSFAKGNAVSKSDIDFLVEFKSSRGLFDDYIHLQQFLESLFRRNIDLVKPSLIRKELKSDILGGVRVEAEI